MNDLQENFWKQRYNSINNDIELNIKNLYSWALVLNQDIKRKTQWIEDKKQITGICHDKLFSSLCNNEKLLANYVIDYNLNLGLSNLTLNKTSSITNKLPKKVNITDDDEIIKIELDLNALDLNTSDLNALDLNTSDLNTSDLNTSDLNTSDLNTSDLNTSDLTEVQLLAETVIQNQRTEYEKLADMMEERRSQLSESCNDNIQDIHKVHFRLGTMGDTEDLEKCVQSSESNTQSKQNGPRYLTEFAGNSNLSLEDQERSAPLINVFFTMTKEKRENIQWDIYQRSKRNVESVNGSNNMKKEDLNVLINQEADRLLQSYIDKYK
jgi:hypothetical protein